MKTLIAFFFSCGFSIAAPQAISLDGSSSGPTIMTLGSSQSVPIIQSATGTVFAVTSTNSNITVNITSGSTILSFTGTLPATGSYVGQVVSFVTNQAVTTFTAASAGTLIGPPTSLVLGGFCGFIWTGSTWQRCN